MTDLSTLSNSLVGLVSPFLTQVIRDRWIKVNDQAAHWLSLVVAAGCVFAAAWINHGPWDFTTLGADIGLAFTLSQVVYHNLLRVNDNGRNVTQSMAVVDDKVMPLEGVEDTPDP